MKMKTIKELKNKISELETKLSEMKEINELFGICLSKENKYPIIFSTINLFCTCATNIKYFYKNKMHSFDAKYLGDSSCIKVLKNSKDHCVFECEDKTKWILSKEKEIIVNLPDDTVFLNDLEIDNSETIKIDLGGNFIDVSPIKEK